MPYFSRDTVSNIPKSPGVYIYRDVDDEVLYVGKAKYLYNRVSTYFSGGDGRAHIESLIGRIHSIEIIITEDERQALILEADLVKKIKPKFNIRLKDDKAPLMLRFDTDIEWPKLELVRKRSDDTAHYYGPFAFSYEAKILYEAIDRLLPLRNCSDKVFRNRVRPCLQYQIHRCAGPCCLDISKEQYRTWVKEALRLLGGDITSIHDDFEHRMNVASEELRFEDAASFRDKINVLGELQDGLRKQTYGGDSIDSFGFHREGELVDFTVIKVREGRIVDSKSFGFEHAISSDVELFESVIQQFYEQYKDDIPKVILAPIDFSKVESFLSESRYGVFKNASYQPKMLVPKRGSKHALLKLAQENASESFETRYSERSNIELLLSRVQELFELDSIPRVIECIDISHFQGSDTVASIVHFKDGKPERSKYRVQISGVQGKADDFASMHEAIMRHLSRCVEEATEPDLVVVDGGPPQLREAIKARNTVGCTHIPIISLAKKKRSVRSGQIAKNPRARGVSKKPERIYLDVDRDPIVLPTNNPVLHLLERLRDEAHKTAITFHRKRRKKRTFKNPLEDVPGVGEKRREKLMETYKSFDVIAQHNPEEISQKTGIPINIVLKVQAHLKKAFNY